MIVPLDTLRLNASKQFSQTTFTATLTKKQIYLVLIVNAVAIAIFICIKQIFFIPLACLTITTLCVPHHVHKFFPTEVQFSIFSNSW